MYSTGQPSAEKNTRLGTQASDEFLLNESRAYTDFRERLLWLLRWWRPHLLGNHHSHQCSRRSLGYWFVCISPYLCQSKGQTNPQTPRKYWSRNDIIKLKTCTYIHWTHRSVLSFPNSNHMARLVLPTRGQRVGGWWGKIVEHMVEIAFCAVRRVILEGRLYVYDK